MKTRLFALAAFAFLSVGALAQGPKATPDEMIAAINAVKMPAVDQTKVQDKAYVADYIKQRNEALKQRDKLIWDFYQAYPTNEKTPDLMNQRWQSVVQEESDIPALMTELGDVIKANQSEPLVMNATYFKSMWTLQTLKEGEGDKAVSAANEFANKYPKDERGSSLLSMAADYVPAAKDRLPLYARIIKDYPDARGTKYISGKVNQINGLGKPFDLQFEDAISGAKTSVQDMKGKVVVIDFWATWCGPCVAELPKMKEIYAKYHDKGVEFVSVSLDQPRNADPTKDGLNKLKDFVGKNDMPWHHYYQGNFWSSEFSTNWGINSIPCLFLVDQKGNLVDVEAREGIEDRIKKLLATNTK